MLLILNYHSVSDDPCWLPGTPRNSVSPELFEAQLKWLQHNGYRSIFISEAGEILRSPSMVSSRERTVALTFDDGYADNWMAAHPLLEKRGMKATIFVSTDFVEDSSLKRKKINEADRRNLEWRGYLNWAEIRAMEESGLVEVQSHGRSHTRVFADDSLKGFFLPATAGRHWLLWNEDRENKHRWYDDRGVKSKLWGHPLWTMKPALANRAYLPDRERLGCFMELMNSRGEDFFYRKNCVGTLEREWSECAGRKRDSSRMESEREYDERVMDELLGSRLILEKKIGRKVEYLCWPENAYSPRAERLAREAGYRGTVSNMYPRMNQPDPAGARLARTFVGSRFFGVNSLSCDRLGFIMQCRRFEGNRAVYPLLAPGYLIQKISRDS